MSLPKAEVAALLAAARAGRDRAYAPYSEFTVGAALLCDDGTIVTGCNVENASLGLSMCAERAALFAAVAGGRRSFAAVAIAGPDGETTPPCGACRQVLAEFNAGLTVAFTTTDGHRIEQLDALLPVQFQGSNVRR